MMPPTLRRLDKVRVGKGGAFQVAGGVEYGDASGHYLAYFKSICKTGVRRPLRFIQLLGEKTLRGQTRSHIANTICAFGASDCDPIPASTNGLISLYFTIS